MNDDPIEKINFITHNMKKATIDQNTPEKGWIARFQNATKGFDTPVQAKVAPNQNTLEPVQSSPIRQASTKSPIRTPQNTKPKPQNIRNRNPTMSHINQTARK